ncbi:RDD family protein [Streptomyces sp. NPDC088260]|uniref:RDD family protein n=1 Tax=Streptomyces sp. NPDC088260 TaxID=3365850 RepID=UPI003825C0C3
MTIPRGEGRSRNLSVPPLPTARASFPPTPGYRTAPHPPHAPVTVRVPPRAGDMRRYLAVGLDCYLCLVAAGLLARPYVHTAAVTEAVGLLLGPALAFSFLNHVVLTSLTGAGAGKLIMGIRVVRLPDAGRPGPRLLLRRWLYGLCWLPLQPWYGLRSLLSGPGALPRTTLWNGGNGEPCTDPLGLRQVRHRGLTAHRAATAPAHR